MYCRCIFYLELDFKRWAGLFEMYGLASHSSTAHRTEIVHIYLSDNLLMHWLYAWIFLCMFACEGSRWENKPRVCCACCHWAKHNRKPSYIFFCVFIAAKVKGCYVSDLHRGHLQVMGILSFRLQCHRESSWTIYVGERDSLQQMNPYFRTTTSLGMT